MEASAAAVEANEEGGGEGGAEQTSCDLRTGRAAPLPLPVAAVAGMRRGPVPVVAFVLALGAAARGGGSGPVTCGSVVKLLNVRHNVRLHSHDVRYGSGNGFRPPPPPSVYRGLVAGPGPDRRSSLPQAAGSSR